MDNDLVSKRRAERCTTHSHACDCREYAHAQEIERLRAEVEGLREQHGRDSAELRRLCAARDEQRDGRLYALERAVVAERERDALRARAERAEARIADAPAVKAMCADLLTRLQRLSGENPVARVILLPEDWPEIERMISVSELRIVAKQNLRSMIVLDSADKKLMLACLEELQ